MTWDLCRRVILSELEARGLTKGEYATSLDALGVKKTTVYEALAGETSPRVDTLFKMLDALGKDLGWMHRSLRAAAAAA